MFMNYLSICITRDKPKRRTLCRLVHNLYLAHSKATSSVIGSRWNFLEKKIKMGFLFSMLIYFNFWKRWIDHLMGWSIDYQPLLSGGVPDLRLDCTLVDVEGARLELDPDGGLGVEVELVAGEAREQLRLAHRGVADEHHLEDVVDPLPQLPVAPAPRHLLAPSSPLSSPISQTDKILLAFSLSRILFSYPSTMPDLPRSNPARILASRAGVSWFLLL